VKNGIELLTILVSNSDLPPVNKELARSPRSLPGEDLARQIACQPSAVLAQHFVGACYVIPALAAWTSLR